VWAYETLRIGVTLVVSFYSILFGITRVKIKKMLVKHRFNPDSYRKVPLPGGIFENELIIILSLHN